MEKRRQVTARFLGGKNLEKQRLAPINEITVRLLCAEELGVVLTAGYPELLGDPRHELVEVIVTNKRRRQSTFKPGKCCGRHIVDIVRWG